MPWPSVVVLRVGDIFFFPWGMCGWSVLGSVLPMGSGALVWSLLMARWIDSKAYTLFPLH